MKARIGSGYGNLRVDGRTMLAHRLAWELAHGPIPAGLNVLHHCDNRPCCRPEHLFLGTLADNTADRDRKGRHVKAGGRTPGYCLPASRRARGERQGSAKLTAEHVAEIRRLAGTLSQETIARRFGIVQTTVSKIIRRVKWAHIE